MIHPALSNECCFARSARTIARDNIKSAGEGGTESAVLAWLWSFPTELGNHYRSEKNRSSEDKFQNLDDKRAYISTITNFKAVFFFRIENLGSQGCRKRLRLFAATARRKLGLFWYPYLGNWWVMCNILFIPNSIQAIIGQLFFVIIIPFSHEVQFICVICFTGPPWKSLASELVTGKFSVPQLLCTQLFKTATC